MIDTALMKTGYLQSLLILGGVLHLIGAAWLTVARIDRGLQLPDEGVTYSASSSSLASEFCKPGGGRKKRTRSRARRPEPDRTQQE